jgi:prohibitin 1
MEKLFNAAIKISSGLSIAGFVGYSCLFTVDGGEAAVMWDMKNGINENKIYKEGTHFKIPIYQEPKILDIRTRPRSISTKTGSKGNLYFLKKIYKM